MRELLTGAELAERLGVSRPTISKAKKNGRFKGCIYNKKYDFIKSCRALGRDHNNIQKSHQSNVQGETKQEEPIAKITSTRKKSIKVVNNQDADKLLKHILEVVSDEENTKDRALLDGLKIKASLIKEYYAGVIEQTKSKKLKENLFDRDEVILILSSSLSTLRKSLLNLPNNYTIALDGLSKIEIKSYVTDDINKILEDFQSVGNRFE